MPYPNEHSARLQSPGRFDKDSFRRTTGGKLYGRVEVPKTIAVIWAKLKDGGALVAQAIRFPVKAWTASKARAWLRKNDVKVLTFEPAATKASHDMVLGYHSGPGLLLSGEQEKDGVPIGRYRKVVIREGEFTKDSDGVEFEVTADTNKHWALVFSQMKEAGIRVPVPDGHTTDPKKNRGWLVDLFVDDEELISVIDILGEDHALVAARSDVSLYVPATFVDGEGREWKRPITHVALCTDPVIPGLGQFVPMAASFLVMKGNEMEWKELQEGLGIEEEMTDENAQELILAAFKITVKEKDVALSAKKTAEDALKLSATGDDPDPIIVKLAAENLTMKFDGLVSAGRATPATRDELVKTFIGDDNAALALSLKKGVATTVADAVIKALMENDPVQLKEQTGPQLLELSHVDKSGDGVLVADAKARAKK